MWQLSIVLVLLTPQAQTQEKGLSSPMTAVFTGGCKGVNASKTVFRWRCVDTGRGPYEDSLDFSPGCVQLQLSPTENCTSTWGTGCNARADTLSLTQTAVFNASCKWGASNHILLKSLELHTLIDFEGCIEDFPFTVYDLTSCPRAPFRGRYEFFSINAAETLFASWFGLARLIVLCVAFYSMLL